MKHRLLFAQAVANQHIQCRHLACKEPGGGDLRKGAERQLSVGAADGDRLHRPSKEDGVKLCSNGVKMGSLYTMVFNWALHGVKMGSNGVKLGSNC